MLTASVCEREIESLHDFFVRWYRGDAAGGDFARVEDALAPTFEIVTPDGEVHDRHAILSYIESSHDRYDGNEFDIHIRNVEPVAVREERALVRYEEWQEGPEGRNGRVSTAVFGPPRTEGGRQDTDWRYVHESWLEPPEG